MKYFTSQWVDFGIKYVPLASSRKTGVYCVSQFFKEHSPTLANFSYFSYTDASL